MSLHMLQSCAHSREIWHFARIFALSRVFLHLGTCTCISAMFAHTVSMTVRRHTSPAPPCQTQISRKISEAFAPNLRSFAPIQTASRQISEAFAQKKQQLRANLNKPLAKTLIWTHNDNKIVFTCKRRCDGFDHDCYVERVCVCVHIYTHTVEQRVGVGLERELRNFSISAQDRNRKYIFMTAAATYI